MKKILFTIFFSIFGLLNYAQTDSLHLSFKGVPIDGPLNEFVSKMQKKGFNLLGIDKDTRSAVLKGDFAGYKGCYIGPIASEQRDLVCKVVVILPNSDRWMDLSNNYYSLKDALIKKYGKPAAEEEFFEGYSEPRDDMSRMQYVFFDRCKYLSIFETEKGCINLRITHNDKHTNVSLVYIDKINDNITQSDAMDDL